MTLSDDVVSKLRISDMGFLMPEFRAKIERLIKYMQDRGHDPMVFETLRLPALQAEYFARGTSMQRDVRKSMHGHGLGADIICRKRQWDAVQAFWDCLRDGCKELWLQWGGLWTSPKDLPHVQWGKYPGVVTIELYAAFQARGLAGSWSDALRTT